MQTEASEILDTRFKEQHFHDRGDIIQQITDQCLQYYLIVYKENESSMTFSTPEVEEVKIKKEITSYLEYPSLEPDANPLNGGN